MNQVKVFPLRFDSEFHKKLVDQAAQEGQSLHQYIINVLSKELNK